MLLQPLAADVPALAGVVNCCGNRGELESKLGESALLPLKAAATACEGEPGPSGFSCTAVTPHSLLGETPKPSPRFGDWSFGLEADAQLLVGEPGSPADPARSSVSRVDFRLFRSAFDGDSGGSTSFCAAELPRSTVQHESHCIDGLEGRAYALPPRSLGS